MQNCMIDIETLGTRPGSVILSIGAVEFDVHDGLGREFYVEISRYSSEHAGFRTDQATLDWWSKQEGEAQTLLERTGRGGLMPHRALIELQNWLPPDPLVWGCGAAFDNAMIAEACAIVGRPPAWSFRNDRCYRTLKALVPSLPLVHQGVLHHGLDDARSQAIHACTLLRYLTPPQAERTIERAWNTRHSTPPQQEDPGDCGYRRAPRDN